MSQKAKNNCCYSPCLIVAVAYKQSSYTIFRDGWYRSQKINKHRNNIHNKLIRITTMVISQPKRLTTITIAYNNNPNTCYRDVL